MEKYYFIIVNNSQEGPFTKEELAAKRILRNTKVWTEGMEDWTEAGNIPDLKEISIAAPPPAHGQSPIIKDGPSDRGIETSPENDKYDYTHPKPIGLVWFGLILLAVIMIMSWYSGGEIYSDYNSHRTTMIWIGLIMRVIVTVLIVENANELNRDKNAWGIFAFLLPIVALISLGLCRKLKTKVKRNPGLSDLEQSEEWLSKAKRLLSNDRESDAKIYLDAILQLNPTHSSATYELALLDYKKQNYKKAEESLKTIVEDNNLKGPSSLYLGYIALVNGRREEAISYWKAAQSNGVEDADKYIIRYETLRGIYLLDLKKYELKLINNLDPIINYDKTFQYSGGFPELDSLISTKSFKSYLSVYHLGLGLAFKQRNYYIAICFYEIKDIQVDLIERKLLFSLITGETLVLAIDNKEKFQNLGYLLIPIFNNFKIVHKFDATAAKDLGFISN